MKVLVAEDDTVSRYALATRLKKMGHEVIACEDGRDAWHAFLNERPRIIVTDWMMPELNGLELVGRIRAERRPQYTYVIMLTALGGKESFLQGMHAGVDDFVTKPIEHGGLEARMRVAERILSLQKQVHELRGLLPICMYCKKIRDEENQWHTLETYVGGRTEMSFSQALCPDCKNGQSSEESQ
jgi:DNA-binding response OmpR family regulator